jgi:hypothetical protein
MIVHGFVMTLVGHVPTVSHGRIHQGVSTVEGRTGKDARLFITADKKCRQAKAGIQKTKILARLHCCFQVWSQGLPCSN